MTHAQPTPTAEHDSAYTRNTLSVPAAEPFLKWAGGKRASAAEIISVFPDTIRNYFEPMLGAGAVYFALARDWSKDHGWRIQRAAYLSDINRELICTHRVVRDQVTALIIQLAKLPYNKTIFEEWKALDPAKLTPLMVATRMIYLNRTCFNGLYRTNRAGRFNVPFGRYTNPTICRSAELQTASGALKGVVLFSGDYRHTCVTLEPGDHITQADGSTGLDRPPPRPGYGDVVYLDPPYLPVSATSNFTSYSDAAFGKKAHEALAGYFTELARDGASVALSNADIPLARELYKGFHVRSIQVKRHINSKAKKRGAVGEILVTANCRGD